MSVASDDGGPPIESLLDMDFYKFTMGQFVYHRYRDVPVRYGFRNRTKAVPLARHIPEATLRQHLDHARTLRFSRSELHYLRGTNEYGERMFTEDYLEFLAAFQLPPYEFEERDDGTFRLEFPGKWSEAMMWETVALSIVNELYYHSRLAEVATVFDRDAVEACGIRRLHDKIRNISQYPGVTFADFGTRRRFSRAWQFKVNELLAELLPPTQFRGTSNTLAAMRHGLLPMGTSAHELFMVMACVMQADDEDIRASHNTVLQEWWEEYGWGLSIALTETFGSTYFFRDMTSRQARLWKGLRHDSGDPFAFGERAIRFYERCGIDPRTKLVVFSDGLELEPIVRLADRFHGRIGVTFGWGTNLTNDLGLAPLSLVVKPVEANGHPCVKLSDNLAKAQGPVEEVERYKRIFGYTNTASVECTY